MKYNAIIRRSTNQSDFYKENYFLFSIRKKYWFKNIWLISDEYGTEIFSFSIVNFLWYSRLRIIKQKLNKEIKLRNPRNNDGIIVNDDILMIKSKLKIFGFQADFLLNEDLFGKVVQKASTLAGIKYEFEFIEENEYNLYFLILFAIYSVGFADVPTAT